MQIQTLARRISLTRTLRGFVHLHIGKSMERFTKSITRVVVELCDKNGRRGGGDKRCRIRVEISGTAPVLVEEQQASIRTAIRHAASRAAAQVRGTLRQTAAPAA